MCDVDSIEVAHAGIDQLAWVFFGTNAHSFQDENMLPSCKKYYSLAHALGEPLYSALYDYCDHKTDNIIYALRL